MTNGFLVLESGEAFKGEWLGGEAAVGEVVFNTSHNGYEEIATDPSYYGQIMVMCAPQQGNYGVDKSFWESHRLWINGFIALDIQQSEGNSFWLNRLHEAGIPAMDELDTRRLVLTLRESGTQVGAMVAAASEIEAKEKATPLIHQFKEMEPDWAFAASRPEKKRVKGAHGTGPKVAVLDFGCKENILRELIKRSREIMLFPARTSAQEIMEWKPDGLLLSNGPGDPGHVEVAVDTIRELTGQLPIFGICMGHQLLARSLGGKTFKLKFGHRGANHPIKNIQSGEVFMTSQNHGYAVDQESLDPSVKVTHMNLNDQTVSGLECQDKRLFSVQFHPESHPGPRDADTLFDKFTEWMDQ